MRPPAFWFASPQRPGLLARALQPLAAIYAAGTRRRLERGPRHDPGVPVISVGNLVAGGAGKTPTTIAILEQLSARGIAVHALSRGYGGRLAGPVRVDPVTHLARDVGDEPILLAAFAPAWVSRDRVRGASAAVAAGAEALVLDDAHQNPGLRPTLSIVVVDAARGFGNGRVLPAGPLREPVEAGLARADLIVLVGDEPARERFLSTWGKLALPPVHHARILPLPTGMDWAGQPVVAFAGIAHPERFFATLEGLGAELLKKVPLDDHQPVDERLFARLLTLARRSGGQIVTTEKDAARLPPALRAEVLALPVRLRFDRPEAFEATLMQALSSRAG